MRRSTDLRIPAQFVARQALFLRFGDQLDRVEVQIRGLLLPGFHQLGLVHVPLVRPRHQRRAPRQVRVVRRIAQAALPHRVLDLRPARGKRFDHLPRDARDLESPVRVGLLDPVAESLQFPGQFAAVQRAEQHLGAVQPLVGHRSPFVVGAEQHVGDHRVRVQHRVQVSGCVMPERGNHRFLVACPDHPPGCGVLQPGLGGVLLEPGQALSDRLVVGVDDAGVAADERGERHGFRRGESYVPSRAVLERAALARAPQAPPGPVRHRAFQAPP